MASLLEQIAEMEAGVERVHQRIPDLPILEILSSRLLIYLGRELSNRFDQYLRPYGLTEIEFRALMALYGAHVPTSPGELCFGISQSPANITRITDVLVERGLLLRLPDTQDRRRLVLQVTPQGEQLINEILPVVTNVARSSYCDFPLDELKQLRASLKKFAAALERTGLPRPGNGSASSSATTTNEPERSSGSNS